VQSIGDIFVSIWSLVVHSYLVLFGREWLLFENLVYLFCGHESFLPDLHYKASNSTIRFKIDISLI